jgi:hypothetical protein
MQLVHQMKTNPSFSTRRTTYNVHPPFKNHNAPVKSYNRTG